MREFQEKKQMHRTLYSPLSIVVLVVIFGFMVKAAWGVHVKQGTSAEKRDQTASEYDVLAAKKVELEVRVAELQTPQGVEREIRDKFRMAKDGEELVVIIDKQGAAAAGEKKGRFDRAWDAVVGSLKDVFY